MITFTLLSCCSSLLAYLPNSWAPIITTCVNLRALLTFSISVFLSILWNNNTYPCGVSIAVKSLVLDNINHSINVNYHYYMQIRILLLVAHWIILHLYVTCPFYVSFSMSTLLTRPMNITWLNSQTSVSPHHITVCVCVFYVWVVYKYMYVQVVVSVSTYSEKPEKGVWQP